MSTDDEIKALQDRLDTRRREASEAQRIAALMERVALESAQRKLDDARSRIGARPMLREVPWLRAVTALGEHAAQPETAAAIASEEARLDAIARRSLTSMARRVELPEHPDLLDVALADAPRETAALVAAREVFEWLERQPRRRPVARIISGPAGTGKTAGVAWAVLHQRPRATLRRQLTACAPALFVAASAVTSTPRNGFSTNVEAWARWIETPVLVVDDAGTEPGDPSLLVSLFVERWTRPSVTLVTTNLDRVAWWRRYASSRLGDRWVREQRAHDFEWCATVEGASLRGERA